jgi:hypothetical protein
VHEAETASPEKPLWSSPEEKDSEPEHSELLKRRVIDAAREGVSAQEISRRYQVGVDQVNLIIRMCLNDDDGSQ